MIGLLKSQFPDGTVRITGSFKEVEELIAAGSDIVAIDGTFRVRENLDGPSFIKAVKEKYEMCIRDSLIKHLTMLACNTNYSFKFIWVLLELFY